MFVEINGLAYNLMFTQSIDKLDEGGKYKILYAISNENKLVEEFDNEADRDAKYEKAQAAGGASKEEIEHIEDEIEHLKEVGFHPLKVEELPTEDIKDYILYLVPSDNPDEENLCYEYLYINNAWEMVGTTSVDLSNYYTKDEVDDKSMFNIALTYSTFEGNFGNMDQRDYQAFLPLLQFIYTKCRGTNRLIKLPFVNIYTAHDAPSWLDSDNSQLFVVRETYNIANGLIHITLDGIPKFNNRGVAKYFNFQITGVIENDNITSIRTVTLDKSTLPVASKSYVDDAVAGVNCNLPVITLNVSSAITSDPKSISDASKVVNDAYNNGIKYTAILLRATSGVLSNGSQIAYPTMYANFDEQKTLYRFYCMAAGESNQIRLGAEFTIYGTWNNNVFTCSSVGITGGSLYSFGNYLKKDNTYEFTPTGDYNPATKKYVDDNASKEYETAEISYNFSISDLRGYINSCKYINNDGPTIANIINAAKTSNKPAKLKVIFADGSNSGRSVQELFLNTAEISTSKTMYNFYSAPTIGTTWSNIAGNPENYYIRVVVSGTWNNDVFTASQGTLYYEGVRFLSLNQTASYTPTNSYHPATKKYVDDAIAAAITNALGGSY